MQTDGKGEHSFVIKPECRIKQHQRRKQRGQTDVRTKYIKLILQIPQCRNEQQ